MHVALKVGTHTGEAAAHCEPWLVVESTFSSAAVSGDAAPHARGSSGAAPRNILAQPPNPCPALADALAPFFWALCHAPAVPAARLLWALLQTRKQLGRHSSQTQPLSLSVRAGRMQPRSQL